MLAISPQEQRQVCNDVKGLILSSGQTALVSRRVDSTQRLYATGDDYTPVEGEPIPIHVVTTPREDLTQKLDATANVLPDAGIATGDLVTVYPGGAQYVVQSAGDKRWFGVVTHYALSLVTYHGHG